MIIPNRKTKRRKGRCTWVDGCRQKCDEGFRFCRYHLNRTVAAMERGAYLTPLPSELVFFHSNGLPHKRRPA